MFCVKYTDRAGVEHTEYYNYVFKSSKNDDDKINGSLEMENGPIYLALVVDREGNGKWETQRVINENNFDNYGNLVKAIAAVNAFEEYKADLEDLVEAAKKAVASIDLSRFDIEASDDDDEEDTPEESTPFTGNGMIFGWLWVLVIIAVMTYTIYRNSRRNENR